MTEQLFPLQRLSQQTTPASVFKVRTQHPSIAEEYEKLMLEQYELFCKKMLDYGVDNIAAGTKLETVDDTLQDLSIYGLIARIVAKGKWK